MSDEYDDYAEDEVVRESTDFKTLLPDDLAADPSLEDINDIESLAKSYVSSQRMLGSSVRIPGEDAGKEQYDEFYSKVEKIPGVMRVPRDSEDSWDDVYNKLGRPDDPNKYNFHIPEEYGFSDEVKNTVESFRHQAYEAGLTQDQAQRIADFEIKRQEQQLHVMQQLRDSSEATLRQKWGSDYNNRLAGAKVALQKYERDYPDAVAMLKNTPLGNNAAIIEMLSDLAGTFNEGDVVSPSGGRTQYGMTADEAREKKEEIFNNRNHAYWNDADPNHNAAVMKVQKLNTIILGD